jgi:ATP-dependent DNA ligase
MLVLAGCYRYERTGPCVRPPGFIASCLPTKAAMPCGVLWLHEIKHDGCRVTTRKDGARVRLYRLG